MSEYIFKYEYDTLNGTSSHTLGEEIVRCGDCEHFAVDQSDHEYRTGWWCKWWGTDLARPDKFCAWASRKESA